MSEPDPRLDMPDAQYWDAEARAARRTGLESVRSTAAKWEASIATLLGVFATVTVIQGPETLADIDPTWLRIPIALAVLVGAVLAGLATYFAARAAQGTPREFTLLGGPTLQAWYQQQGPKAISDLRLSRILALAAVGSVLLAMTVGWLTYSASGSDQENGSSFLVVFSDGTTRCGELSLAGDQDAIDVGGGSDPIALRNVVDIEPVAACPEPSPDLSPGVPNPSQ